MDYSNYDMPEPHDRLFHQMLSLELGTELPVEILDHYWSYKLLCDRSSVRINDWDIARMCYEFGRREKPPEKTVVDLWKEKSVKSGHRVSVSWRGEQREGKLQKVTASGSVVVILDGDSEDRAFGAGDVHVLDAVS